MDSRDQSATDVISQAIHDHVFGDDFPKDEATCCGPTAMDALKAAGFAVVQLPERLDVPVKPEWMKANPLGGWKAGRFGRITAWDSGHVNFDAEALTPGSARFIAAALLAAAEAAESGRYPLAGGDAQ